MGEELVHAQEGDFYGGWITVISSGHSKDRPGRWGGEAPAACRTLRRRHVRS
jgi:hypothetical protein